jgi:arsenate reductase (glutaredoxin)
VLIEVPVMLMLVAIVNRSKGWYEAAPSVSPQHAQRKGMIMDVTIYHNPACGTSRNTLALIRAAGIEPKVVEYLKAPPTRDELARMIADAGLTVRQAIREKGTPYAERGLDSPDLTDEQLLDAMLKDPQPHQPTVCRHTLGHAACPPVRGCPRHPAGDVQGGLRQGGRRAGPGREGQAHWLSHFLPWTKGISTQ